MKDEKIENPETTPFDEAVNQGTPPPESRDAIPTEDVPSHFTHQDVEAFGTPPIEDPKDREPETSLQEEKESCCRKTGFDYKKYAIDLFLAEISASAPSGIQRLMGSKPIQDPSTVVHTKQAVSDLHARCLMVARNLGEILQSHGE